MTSTIPQLGGLLGEALAANLRGRLSHFIVDEHSPAIALFAPERRRENREGDWYGEHAGKWLVAAAKAAARGGDAALRASVLRVADYLVSVQEADGYLGTYAPDHRFMRPQPPKPVSWDGAPSVRTWDIWTHAYLILGLLEVHRHFPASRYLDAACRIGELCRHALTDGGIDITELGNHHGLSATVLMDPAVELYFATGEPRYLELAQRVLQQADGHPELALLTRALAGADVATIATGKAYQLAWNLVGLAKLHRATGNDDYRRAAEHAWRSIREHHLTLGGGPWGGVAHRSREVFNPAGVFSPYGYVETCSSLAWIQLNRELLAVTGEARYAEEIERTAYNDLLGAQAPNGEDWCYYVFPNGKRVHTTYWRCCKSSGAMALEELPALAYVRGDDGTIAINLYGAGSASFALDGGGELRIEQHTAYPYPDDVHLRLAVDRPMRFALKLRIPSWADGATLAINGEDAAVALTPGHYAMLDREWHDGDEIVVRFPVQPRLHRAVNRNVQESRAPDGSEVRQEVLRFEYAAITCGPLVYATGLIDGFKVEETLRLPDAPPAQWLTLQGARADGVPRITLDPGYRAPLEFTPYFATGGRVDGSWRLSWLPLAPEPPASSARPAARQPSHKNLWRQNIAASPVSSPRHGAEWPAASTPIPMDAPRMETPPPESKAAHQGPLAGVRVLDLSAYIAGPYACSLLADQGADVIKVEPPDGDNLRQYPSTLPSESRAFLGVNRSKRGIVLDLKRAQDHAVLLKLVRDADVLVHNFRPGVPERLGIGHEQLNPINPRLVYCAITGYGDSGPLKDKAGYDQVLQTMTGMCTLQGKRGGPPEIIYGSVVDYYAAALLAAGVSSALYERERSGLGQFVGVSLLRSALTMQSARMIWAEGESLDIGRDMRSGGVTGIHPTREGWIYISANTPRFWKALCAKTGLDALARDPRYDSVRKRAQHFAEILPPLHAALAARSALEWEALFGDEVPCAAARRIEDMFDHPQVQAQGIIDTFEHPVVGRYRGVAQSIRFGRTPGPAPFAAPVLGQDTAQVIAAVDAGTPIAPKPRGRRKA